MVSKLDELRSGKSVETRPGVFARLNLQDKTYETSDGKKIYAGDDPDFFPQNEEGLKVSREKEQLESSIKKSSAGEFLYQLGQHGIPAAAKDWANKLTKSGEDYLRTKRVQGELSKNISERSPWTSGAATVASFAPDIALTHGMGGLGAGATLAATHAGPRIIETPGEVAQEVLISAAGGKLVEMGANGLNRIAARRGQIREFPGKQAEVRAQNLSSTENYKNKLMKYESELDLRKNKMIENQNAYMEAKTARDADIVRLKNEREVAKINRSANQSQIDNEYKLAVESAKKEEQAFAQKYKQDQADYQKALKDLPVVQKEAQREYSQQVIKNAEGISKSFPKESKIYSEQLGIDDFIENNIRKSGLSGSSEANKATRFLNSVFPEGEILSGRELSKRYQAIEEAIQRSSPEMQGILNEFKSHIGDRLPSIIEDTVLHSKFMPLLKRTIDSDIKSTISKLDLGKNSVQIEKIAKSNAERILKNKISSNNFVNKIQNGELAESIAHKILSVEDLLLEASPERIKQLKKEGLFEYVTQSAKQQHDFFIREMTNNLENKIARYEIKAGESARKASQKLSNDIKQTYGVAPKVPEPISPTPSVAGELPVHPGELPQVSLLQIPQPVSQPSELPFPKKPMAPPLIPEPTLPQSQGLSGTLGNVLEKNLLGGRGLVNNPLTKLAGLKYALGSAALPVEAGYLAMKGLTSPTAAGEAARMTFKQGGIQFVDMLARRYPSYKDGILQSPMDRRSLTKELEDNPEIPIEQKSVIQSKINRGKPIQSKL